VALADDLERVAAAAAGADGGLTGVLATEPASGRRIYLCAFEARDGGRTWLAVDDSGEPIRDRREVRDAVSIAALCEVAEEAAGVEPDSARVASPALLDELGADAGPDVAEALKGAADTVEELVRDVERGYKRPLS